VARYFVIIEDAEPVWPPVAFDDYVSAYAHAVKVAKTWEGVHGSPIIRVKGIDGYDPSWTADELLRVERIINRFKNLK
jgi:hypothetical protein